MLSNRKLKKAVPPPPSPPAKKNSNLMFLKEYFTYQDFSCKSYSDIGASTVKRGKQ